MWPSITVKLLQNPEAVHSFWGISRESWAIIAQCASAFAIGYAAWIAGRYQKKKDKLARKQKMLSHLAILRLFNETVVAYFYVAKGGTDLPHYYNQFYILKQMWEEIAKIQELKDEIASNLPLKAVEHFHRFVSYSRTVDKMSDLKDANMEDAWRNAEDQLHKVIAIIEYDMKPFPFNHIFDWWYSINETVRNKKTKKSKQKN
nr:hypothetical protein [uncultured Sphaerochaeta sp.]